MPVKPTKYIDLQEVALLLGVSSATIKNWIKSEYITPKKLLNKKTVFDHKEIQSFNNKLISGEINRLNKRANKKNSSHTFIPKEYAEDKKSARLIQNIITFCNQNNLEKNKVLLTIAINLLKRKKLVNYKKISSFIEIEFKNKILKKEINWWIETIKNKTLDKNYLILLDIHLPETSDILGLIYQSLSTEGKKSEKGSYYTPKKIVEEISNTYIKENYFALDPCCGTGQFLISFAKKIKNPNQIWGFDIDERAVRLARLNLILCFPETEFKPNIYHKNTLFDINNSDLFPNLIIPKFDIIATNPPWGAHLSKDDILTAKTMFPEISSGEIFSYFIKKSLDLLKEDGILSFILPEAILNIKTHKDIRKIILLETTIKKIIHLNRVFKNVFTPVIQLDIVNKKPNSFNIIETKKNGNFYKIKQEKLKTNNDYILNVFINDLDILLIDKIYKTKHITLKNNADWALGIVTGNNKKYLFDHKLKTNEPLLTGKDIKKFSANSAKKFITFNPSKFQQVAPEYKYRAKEKLIYKFISKELVFCYDDKQILTLNSANIVIPKIKNYPIKTILALFNSSLYQFIYQKKFNSFKILKNDIEQLPLPILTNEKHSRIEAYLNKLLNNKEPLEVKNIYLELDNYIMKLFNLNKKEKELIKKSIKISDKLLNII